MGKVIRRPWFSAPWGTSTEPPTSAMKATKTYMRTFTLIQELFNLLLKWKNTLEKRWCIKAEEHDVQSWTLNSASVVVLQRLTSFHCGKRTGVLVVGFRIIGACVYKSSCRCGIARLSGFQLAHSSSKVNYTPRRTPFWTQSQRDMTIGMYADELIFGDASIKSVSTPLTH